MISNAKKPEWKLNSENPQGHNMHGIIYLLHANEILGRLFEDNNSFHSESSEVLSINIGGDS